MAPIRLILYTSKHLSRAIFPRSPAFWADEIVLDLPVQVNEKAPNLELAVCSGVWSSAAFTVTNAPPTIGGFS
jgi:hypothetical protein